MQNSAVKAAHLLGCLDVRGQLDFDSRVKLELPVSA
jgi:hypothetical protein